MAIIIVNRKTGIALDLETLTSHLPHIAGPAQCMQIDIGELRQLKLHSTDQVLLAFGYGTSASDGVSAENTLREALSLCQKQGATAALCTGMIDRDTLIAAGEDAPYCRSGDSQLIHRLADDLRLRVCDLENYSHAAFLANLPDAFDASAISAFLGSWIDRRLLPQDDCPYHYGASFYPELWADSVNESDMDRVAAIGMTTVRLGEFFWDKLEPADGEYHMEYLDALLNSLEKRGIDAIVGIPTPTPPRWMTRDHDTNIVLDDGRIEGHGSRQHCCTKNPFFRRKAFELTARVAQTADRHRNVKAIQIDNEFKARLCFCDTCRALWPQWLKEHYGTVDAMNEAWGTSIWSERYDDFDSVVLPGRTPFRHNSALDNAFHRFCEDEANDFASGEAQIIVACTSIPVTHNTSMGFDMRNFDLFNQLDFVSFDTYIPQDMYWAYTLNLDRWRNLLPRDDFMLMETSASHAGHIGNYVSPHPAGYVPQEAFLAYASGAKAFMYWLLRAQAYGVEQPHSAVLTQNGEPDLGYADVLETAHMLKRYEPMLAGSRPIRSTVALMYSDDAKRYYDIDNGGIYNYRSLITDFYRMLLGHGISVEVIPENALLDSFECVLVPFVRHVGDDLRARLHAFADRGGTLILGPMTADRTGELTWPHDGDALDGIGSWLGLTDVVAFLANDSGAKVEVRTEQGNDRFTGMVTMFKVKDGTHAYPTDCDVADGRTILASRGTVSYVGGLPADPEHSPFWDDLIERLVKPHEPDRDLIRICAGLVKYRRSTPSADQLWLANMTDSPLPFTLMRDASDERGTIWNRGEHTLDGFSRIVLTM
ncbi:beta-galactosidase [Bifidobacterium sp. LC6]|uniref:beta-galactosidase n=1 Tax=Bifidobacterium colobi TaxID=2809026 RepID=A0ABS5UVA7_9BIFI|nr:beta-galactosidase [Bifidobacterium colobi]MBT1174601.1 beta-galactosidase [Bifidobacterium colobi]